MPALSICKANKIENIKQNPIKEKGNTINYLVLDVAVETSSNFTAVSFAFRPTEINEVPGK